MDITDYGNSNPYHFHINDLKIQRISSLSDKSNSFNTQNTTAFIRKTTDRNNSHKSFLKEKIIQLAKQDASTGTYMNDEFVALRKRCIFAVSPNRAAAIAQVNHMIHTGSAGNDTISDGSNPIIKSLPVLSYQAKITPSPTGISSVQILNKNGEIIASYHWQSGWISVPTLEETKKCDELNLLYHDAYSTADKRNSKSPGNSKISTKTRNQI